MRRALFIAASAAVLATAIAAPARADGGGFVFIPLKATTGIAAKAPDPVPPRAAAAQPHRAAVPSDAIEGFGNGVPLSFAVREIVPQGDLVSFGPGVDAAARVSWAGGPDWHAVLERLAASAGASVAYEGQLVTLVALPGMHHRTTVAPVAPPPNPAPVVAAADVEAPAPRVFRAPRVHGRIPAAVAAVPGTENYSGDGGWHAASGDTLDQVLSDWCAKAGWKLVYKSRLIYTLQASAEFHGDFLKAAGDLVASIAASPHPLAVFHTGNSALVIDNGNQ